MMEDGVLAGLLRSIGAARRRSAGAALLSLKFETVPPPPFSLTISWRKHEQNTTI